MYLRASKELSGQLVQGYIISMSLARVEKKYLPYGESGGPFRRRSVFLQINEN